MVFRGHRRLPNRLYRPLISGCCIVCAHSLGAPSMVVIVVGSVGLHECCCSSMDIELFKVGLSRAAVSNRVLFDLNLLSWCQERV
jgi:hypothetical protein